MLKVIIADDEPVIRNGLRKMFEKDYMGCEVVAFLKHGGQVMDCLKRQTIDLVITDINMPEYSGLEIAEYVYSKRLNTQIIIISGYREFEYAQKAVEYNVQQYILKPIDREQLKLAIKKAAAVIDRQRKQLAAEKEREKWLTDIKYQDLAMLCNGMVDLDDLLKMRQQTYPLEKMAEQPCVITDVIWDHEASGLEKWSYGMDRLHTAIVNMCKNSMQQRMSYYILEAGSSQVRGLVLIDQENIGLALIRAEKMKERLREVIHECLQLSTRVEIQFYTCLREMNQVRRVNPDTGQLVTEKARVYLSLLMEGDKSTKDALVHHIIREAGLREFRQFLLVIVCYAAEMIDREFLEERQKIEVLQSKEEMKTFFYQLESRLELEQKGDTQPVIEKIMHYIDANFSKDISLSDVAEAVYMNPAYISRLFKKETGEKFIDYLIKVRMHQAMELLALNQYTVVKVAELVGYSQVKYFSRIFKKHTGLSPKEYATEQADRRRESDQA